MCAACKHADWKMFFLTADVQCDFGPYLFTKGGRWEGEAQWDKMEKRLTQDEEADGGWRERKREIVQERQQIPGGRSQRDPMIEMNEERQLGGGANQQEREEEWQRHRVIQTKLGCQRKQKEQRQRATHHPSHGLRSLNIYITQCQRHKEAIRERESGLCTGPDMAGHLWILHKFRKKNKKILAVWGPVRLNALLHDWW